MNLLYIQIGKMKFGKKQLTTSSLSFLLYLNSYPFLCLSFLIWEMGMLPTHLPPLQGGCVSRKLKLHEFIWNQARLTSQYYLHCVNQYKLNNFSELISSSVKKVTTSLTGLFLGLNDIMYINYPDLYLRLCW